MSVANINMTYGAANQLLTIKGQSTLFDNDGNLLKIPSQGNLLDLSYDSRNRLIQAVDPHPLGSGGGKDFTNSKTIPDSDIIDIIDITDR